MNPFLDYLFAAIAVGTAFLYGCTGEILTEKAGHLNLGIPGIMCVGGGCGCLALKLMYQSGLPPFLIVTLAILASFAGGMMIGGVYSFLTVTLKANQNVTGLAITIFGQGVTRYIMSFMATPSQSTEYLYALKYFRFPFSARTDSLLYWGVMLYLAIIIALLSSFILNKTRVGLNLRAVGENPAAADAASVNVPLYKYAATCIGSGIAALGGLFYIMDYSGSCEAYKSIEPLGWLAVALVIFTLWRPHLSIIGSFLFGILYLAGTRLPSLPGINLRIPTPVWDMLPYVVTILVLIISSIRKKRENQPPASLGIPYFREER